MAKMLAPYKIVLVFLIAAAAVFANGFHGCFHFDDFRWIENNPEIYKLHSPLWYLQDGRGSRGIITLTLAINYWLNGTRVFGYHVVNLTIHLLNGILLWAVVRRTLRRGRLCPTEKADLLAGVISLLWLIHPLQTESVTYVIQRTESLAASFYLLAIYSFIRYDEAERPVWACLTVAACIIGAATKQILVTAPLALLLYDFVFCSGSVKLSLRRRPLFYLGVATTWPWIWYLHENGRLIFTGASQTAGFGYPGVTPFYYFMTECRAILMYLRLAFWPHPLCMDYRWHFLKTLPAALPALLPMVALAAMTLYGLGRRHWAAFFSAWALLILAPSSSIVPLADAVSEHRMYLPLACVISVVVVGIYRVAPRLPAIGVAMVAVVAIGEAFLTVERNFDYYNAKEMVRKTIEVAPDNARAHHSLGRYLEREGKHREAIAELRRALELQPNYVQVNLTLATALTDVGEYDEAVRRLQEFVKANPNDPAPRVNLGVTLQKMGRMKEAEAQYKEAVRLSPRLAAAHNNLGILYGRAGKLDLALEHFEAALATEPDDANSRHNLEMVLLMKRRTTGQF